MKCHCHTAPPNHFYIMCDFFCALTAELISCNRDHMRHKIYNIYHLALSRTYLLTLHHFIIVYTSLWLGEPSVLPTTTNTQDPSVHFSPTHSLLSTILLNVLCKFNLPTCVWGASSCPPAFTHPFPIWMELSPVLCHFYEFRISSLTIRVQCLRRVEELNFLLLHMNVEGFNPGAAERIKTEKRREMFK